MVQASEIIPHSWNYPKCPPASARSPRASAVPRDADVTATHSRRGAYDRVAGDPARDPVGRPDLQESLVGIDDLDLVATVEPAELEERTASGLELIRTRR